MRDFLGWGALQWRRIAWVIQDLRACLGGARRLFRSGHEPQVAIGLLEGQVHALLGRPNVYRIRLVNEAPDAIAVVLHLRGERDAGRPMETRAERTLSARVACELFLVTDWLERFELSPAAPATDGLEFLVESRSVGYCRLAAVLEADATPLHRLAIRQALAA